LLFYPVATESPQSTGRPVARPSHFRSIISSGMSDIAIAHSSPEQTRVVSRRLTDHRTYVYASQAYLSEAAPIAATEDLKKNPFIGFVDELLFPPEVRFSDAIGVEPRIRSTNVLAQLHATLSGSGLCVLPAFIASSNPTLVPVLPDQVSFTRSYHLHIHEDHRKAPHVREVSGFIAAEVERNHSLFHEPTARPVASPENMRQNRRL
jgi:DNA-binding transcriptional LysR family regulator